MKNQLNFGQKEGEYTYYDNNFKLLCNNSTVNVNALKMFTSLLPETPITVIDSSDNWARPVVDGEVVEAGGGGQWGHPVLYNQTHPLTKTK